MTPSLCGEFPWQLGGLHYRFSRFRALIGWQNAAVLEHCIQIYVVQYWSFENILLSIRMLHPHRCSNSLQELTEEDQRRSQSDEHSCHESL